MLPTLGAQLHELRSDWQGIRAWRREPPGDQPPASVTARVQGGALRYEACKLSDGPKQNHATKM
jgi:hypothetical protein